MAKEITLRSLARERNIFLVAYFSLGLLHYAIVSYYDRGGFLPKMGVPVPPSEGILEHASDLLVNLVGYVVLGSGRLFMFFGLCYAPFFCAFSNFLGHSFLRTCIYALLGTLPILKFPTMISLLLEVRKTRKRLVASLPPTGSDRDAISAP